MLVPRCLSSSYTPDVCKGPSTAQGHSVTAAASFSPPALRLHLKSCGDQGCREAKQVPLAPSSFFHGDLPFLLVNMHQKRQGLPSRGIRSPGRAAAAHPEIS